MFVLSVLAVLQWISRYAVVHAQTTQAVCTPAHSWMLNSKGQSPCLVAAYLHLPCVQGSNTNVVAMTNPAQFYSAKNDECQCNMVSYALFEACQNCQFDNGTSVTSYSRYSLNCTTQNIGYPETIPVGTAVPAWAYQDVTLTDFFNLTAAFIVAAEKLPDKTASIPAASSASTSSSFTAATRTTMDSSPTATGSAPLPPSSAATHQGKRSVSVGPVVGGAVGGVLGFILLGGIVFFYLRRRSRRPVHLTKRQTVELMSPVYPGSKAWDGCKPSGRQPMAGSLPLYSPGDPRTYPIPPVAAAVGRPLSLRAPVQPVQPHRQAALAYYKGGLAAAL
ncbi:hypothetical protein K466DRAFT_404726 [Polyporus arcularius HHB13444]|uniref:Mid2 domain-containing protein n=1 Tax=Polyporus arcularius HHB13444 TaxID=1314778 RepID=A0A5C3NRF5_9APHY|nr:hypothetical protein K466DRAFT_404726 [Polyporus arcularius HHB13444]